MEPGFFKYSNRLSVHRQCKQLIATSFTLYLALQATGDQNNELEHGLGTEQKKQI
jgi:hypothetical protein